MLETDVTAVRDEWDELASRTGAVPFVRPGWILPWHQAFGTGRLELATVRRDGRLVAAMPVCRRAGRLSAPTNSHSPLFAPIAEDAASAAALLGALCAEPVAALQLDLLEPDVVAQVRAAAHDTGRTVCHRQLAGSPHVALEGSWDDYVRRFSRNRRKEWRRIERRLGEQGAVDVEISRGDGDLDAQLEEVFAIEGSGWKEARGTAIASQPHTRAFYTAVARWAAEQGWLRLCFLRVDGAAVAVDLALVHGGRWYALKGGYDVAWARWAPGITLLRHTLRCAFEEGLERFELLGAPDPYKLVWATGTSERAGIGAFARSPLGRIAHLLAEARERARPLARRVRQRARAIERRRPRRAPAVRDEAPA